MPDAIRTHDLQSRSLTLYPTELRAHIQLNYYIGYLRLLQGETRKTKKYSKLPREISSDGGFCPNCYLGLNPYFEGINTPVKH